jgi:superfamily II DNA or RNA helicase
MRRDTIMKLTIRRNLEIQGADQELKEYLKSLLTTVNPEYVEAKTFGRWTGHIEQYIKQFTETKEGKLVIPRGQLHHLLTDLGREWEVEDNRVAPESEKLYPESDTILRVDDQEPAVSQLLSYENGFLSAPAGSGKTVMGLIAAQRLGLKCLWLTHRKELMDQVIDEIEEHLNIPRAQVGLIHGKKWKIGEQITVGMIPTLSKRDLTPLEEEFGIIIVDEAHHVPSKTFLMVVNNFAAKYVYGLSATAYRRDKLESVMFNSIGPVVSKIEHEELFEEEHLMIPTIRRRQTRWYPLGGHLMEYHEYMEKMIYDEPRNRMIVDDVVEECRDSHNTAIVLVSRTKHAEVLTEMLKQRDIRCEFVVGAVDVEEVPEKGKKKKKKAIPKEVRNQIVSDFKEGRIQVLVATYDLLAEGFNYRPLNRLFMASPIKWKGTVVQSLGRIQRTAEGKNSAVAYDYIDDQVAMFVNQAEARYDRVYRKMGMPVEER